MNKKQLLAHTVFLLLQEAATDQPTSLIAIASAVDTQPKEALRMLENELCRQVTLTAIALKQPELGPLYLECPRYWFRAISFSDCTSIWIRTLARRVLKLLIAAAEADQFCGAC